MIHLGDITKISGYEAPIVDCVIGGSPCQGLSVAGMRLGLDDERSGLFMEQVRIVKEMREHDKRLGRTGVAVRPRYLVWENVPGAQSTGTPKGEDFRIVLEEIARIADETAVIPRPADGKWTTSGCIVADWGSIAWRVLDSQWWGVPQRRRRICLVADFNGQTAADIVFDKVYHQCERSSDTHREFSLVADFGGASAPEIPFVRDSLYGDTDESQQARKEAAASVADGVGVDDRAPRLMEAYQHHGYRESDTCGALTAEQNNHIRGDTLVIVNDIYCIDGDKLNKKERRGGSGIGYREGSQYTLTAKDVHGVAYTLKVRSGVAVDSHGKAAGKGALVQTELAGTIAATQDRYLFQPVVFENHSQDSRYKELGSVSETVSSKYGTGGNNQPLIVDQWTFSKSKRAQFPTDYIVRRLTPLECERLQGFPDGWTDIGEWVDSKGKKRKTSDANRYRALGNSIALPVWKWILKRLCAQYERDATMASLFDGIGGFPLIWEQLNGKGSCLWASEIEEFPMAVTKKRFGG